MKLRLILDICASNLIVLFTFLISMFLWNFLVNFNDIFTSLYFPFGIIVLGFLFFYNKIIFAFILGYFLYFFLCDQFSITPHLNNYFMTSLALIICTPMSVFIFDKLKLKIGTGKNCKLNKINIFHVIFIIFFASIVYNILILFFNLIYENKLIDLNFSNFLGGILLLLLMKTVVNIPFLVKKCHNFYLKHKT